MHEVSHSMFTTPVGRGCVDEDSVIREIALSRRVALGRPELGKITHPAKKPQTALDLKSDLSRTFIKPALDLPLDLSRTFVSPSQPHSALVSL